MTFWVASESSLRSFDRYIERAQPRLFLHGHQHVNQDTLVGRTQVMGVYGQRRIQL